jgi:Fe-S cluster assembly protein SufD
MNTDQDIDWLKVFRQDAQALFAKTGFPKPTEEEWRYTNLSRLEKKNFTPQSPAITVNETFLTPHYIEGAWVMVFIDGYFSVQYSRVEDLDTGIELLNLTQVLKTQADKLKSYLGKAVKNDEHNFIAFNSAGFTDGVFLRISENHIAKKSLQIIHYVTRPNTLANTRTLIVAEPQAHINIIETFIGENTYLTSAVNEVFLAKNAQVTLYKVQQESQTAYHFGGTYCQQQPESIFNHHNFAFGALLARSDVHTDLETAAACSFKGLYLGVQRQHIDNHTRINHNKPHAISDELYKGILNDRARGVFQGRIRVEKDAQQTCSSMNNHNLLLSNDAEIDTKPQLEIYADDVKCGHGITIGQLDEKALFYLQSRGIDLEAAKKLLTFAFANEMIDYVNHKPLKKILRSICQIEF